MRWTARKSLRAPGDPAVLRGAWPLVLLWLIGGGAWAQQAFPGPAPVLVPPPFASPPSWVMSGAAELQVLDKIYARAAVRMVRRGESMSYGDIDIAVLACHTRPPDQAPDAAVFLVITERDTGVVPFRGWMFANNPAIAMLEHPIYDIRVLRCAP